MLPETVMMVPYEKYCNTTNIVAVVITLLVQFEILLWSQTVANPFSGRRSLA